MKINTIIIGLFLVSILILSGCAQQQTKYVCPDGSTVSDASYCPKQENRGYCGDGTCNNNEDCESCSSDCGKCPTKCEIDTKNYYQSSKKYIECTDETGMYTTELGNHCDWDNKDSTVPSQTHRSSKIVQETLTCENNRCKTYKEVVKDCSDYDTAKEKGLCGETESGLAVCSLYAKDGSYYKPLD